MAAELNPGLPKAEGAGMNEDADKEFWRLYQSIRRTDWAVGTAWAAALVSGMIVTLTDLDLMIRLFLDEHISISAAIAFNAILVPLTVVCYAYSRIGGRKIRQMVDEARAIKLATGISIPGDLTVKAEGIVCSGFRGRGSLMRWNEIESVTYGNGYIYFGIKKKRRTQGCATGRNGIEYDLKEVAKAITTHLPEDKWKGAKGWLELQMRGDE